MDWQTRYWEQHMCKISEGDQCLNMFNNITVMYIKYRVQWVSSAHSILGYQHITVSFSWYW